MLSDSSTCATITVDQPEVEWPRSARAVHSARELRTLVAPILRRSFPGVRMELYLRDASGELARVDGPAEPARPSSLAALRARLAVPSRVFDAPCAVTSSALERHRSLMSAPLLADGDEVRGVVVLEAGPGTRDFAPEDLEVLEGVAGLLSLAVQRLPAPPSRGERRRELDLTAARRVQRALMSAALPAEAGVTAHTGYQPALGVGGDFYSLKYLGDGKVGLAIGDVSGNGVSAALVMSRVASDIERGLDAGESPSALLDRINGSLSAGDGEMYVTAACLRLDTRSRRVHIANAGHLPLVIRRPDGETWACAGASGMPLGMFPGSYFEEELTLERGDVVVLLTDGLLEALDHPSGHRGLQLLLGEVRAAPHDARLVSERIGAAVERSRREHELDDVTWVSLQLTA